MVALSSLFAPSVLAGIRFPLGPGSSPPLHFRTLLELEKIRRGSVGPSDSDRSEVPDALVRDKGGIPSVLDQLSVLDKADDADQFGRIALALLLLGYGYTDECHNLITPQSWPEDIHFAHGPSVYQEVSPAVRAFASYAHSLVHRREAFQVGEFGMPGFANANYWSGTVFRSDGAASLPHRAWRSGVLALVAQEPYAASPPVTDWCSRHGLVGGRDDDGCFFEGRAVHELCATVLRSEPEDPSAGDAGVLRAFAEEVVAAEIRILLDECLVRAGLDDVGAGGPPPSTVDEGVAMRAAKTVSSAHLDRYTLDGSIVLRSVLDGSDASPLNEALVRSAAAGIGCRLLQCPACRMVPHSGDDGVLVVVATDGAGSVRLGQLLQRPDHCFGPRDSVAFRWPPPPGKDGKVQGDLWDALKGPEGEGSVGLWGWIFEACTSDDAEAVFADPLFGTRGETPTTVVQWSKGTIF